jgi:hypothetical protein
MPRNGQIFLKRLEQRAVVMEIKRRNASEPRACHAGKLLQESKASGNG